MTYHFPDAYAGSNTKIRDTLNNLILKSPQNWQTSVGLPFFQIQGTVVEWVCAARAYLNPLASLCAHTLTHHHLRCRTRFASMCGSCSACRTVRSPRRAHPTHALRTDASFFA